MSTVLEKRPLAAALQDARDFCRLFPQECWERWQVAGSVRRKKPEVGDVEHVIIPAFGEVTRDGSLWPERVNLLWHHLDALVGGQVQKHFGANGPCWGEKQRRLVFRDHVQEIFTADADNWGAQLAIRTGPGEYSRMLVTKLQWSGYMNHGGYVRDKNDWMCPACGWNDARPVETPGKLAGGFTRDPEGRDGEPTTATCPRCGPTRYVEPGLEHVPDEETYFRLCGVAFVPPEERGIPS